jgi:hypothetical protein
MPSDKTVNMGSLVRMGGVGLVEERGDERGDLWEVFFEGEVAGVEEVDLGIEEVV